MNCPEASLISPLATSPVDNVSYASGAASGKCSVCHDLMQVSPSQLHAYERCKAYDV